MFANSKSIIGVPTTDLNTIKHFSKQAESRLSKPESNYIVGAFMGDKLVMSVAGYYEDTYNHWYSHSNMSSGVGATEYVRIGNLLMMEILPYFEGMGYYSWYSRRSLSHQCIHEWAYTNKRFPDTQFMRYHHCWEKIYMAGEEVKFKNHEFYFRWKPSYPVETVVVLHTLTNEHRLEKFRESNPEIFDGTILQR
jgi:hypothetical protein